MARQGLSLYEDVLGNKKTLQTLNPRELGLLATNFKDTDVGLGAERWIQSAPMSYWQQHMKPHPTAIWDEGGNLTPLPVTGASLLNPIYNPGGPVAYWLQKQSDSPVQRPDPPVQRPVKSAMAKVTRLAAQNGVATSGLTEMSMDELLQRSDMPMQVVGQEITRRNQIYTPELAAQRPGYFQSQFATLSAAQPAPVTESRDVTKRAFRGRPSTGTTGTATVETKPTRAEVSTGITVTDTATQKPTRTETSTGVTGTGTGRGTGAWISKANDWITKIAGGSPAQWIESIAEYGQYVDPTGILFTADKIFDAYDVLKAVDKGDWATAIAEGLALYGPVEGMYDSGGKLLTAPQLFGGSSKEALKKIAQTYYQQRIKNSIPETRQRQTEAIFTPTSTSLTERQEESGIEASTDVFDKGKRKEGEDPAGPKGRVKTDIGTELSPYPEEIEISLPAYEPPVLETGPLQDAQTGGYPINYAGKGDAFLQLLADQGDTVAADELAQRKSLIAQTPDADFTGLDYVGPDYQPEPLSVVETEPVPEPVTEVIPAEFEEIPEVEPTSFDFNYSTADESTLKGLVQGGNQQAQDELDSRTNRFGDFAYDPEGNFVGTLGNLAERIQRGGTSDETRTLIGREVLDPTGNLIGYWDAGIFYPPEYKDWRVKSPWSKDENGTTVIMEGKTEPGTALTPTETVTALTPTVPTPTGAEDMADLAKARRDYFEQYEAPAIRAQSEQERSALGQLRGQMMARQGLMGSPLGVGLGVQQEAQMRGLAMQEVGRGRSAMELQLAEQRYRADQAAADRALQAQQFGVTTGLQEQEIELRRKQLEGTLGLERAAQDIRREEFGTTTALQQVGQNLQEREYLSNLRLQQAQQGLQEQQLAGTLKREEIDQRFRDRQLNETLGIERTDQEIRQQQFTDTLALQKIDQALQQKQFDANWAMQELELVLKQRQVDNTQLLQEADLAYRNRLQEFNEAQAKFQRSVTEEQLRINREELDNATRRLNQADEDRKIATDQFDRTLKQTKAIEDRRNKTELAVGVGNILANDFVWDFGGKVVNKLFKDQGQQAQDLKEALENLQQGLKDLDNQPMLPGSEADAPPAEEVPVVGGPDYVGPDYTPEEAELSPMPEEVELSPMPEATDTPDTVGPASPDFGVADYQPGQVSSETPPSGGYTDDYWAGEDRVGPASGSEGGMYPLQSESGSSSQMGVWGTPSAEQVAETLTNIRMSDKNITLKEAIATMIEGFEEGYRTGSDDEEASAPVRNMMSELAMMESGSVEGALRYPDVIAVINKHLSGTAGLGTATATTNGTATVGTEDYVSPDYKAHQQQMVDDLIMMADYEYDDNAMIAQFNKTDIRRLIGAAEGASLPFSLTARQKMSLNKMVSQPWFQAAMMQQGLGGGNI